MSHFYTSVKRLAALRLRLSQLEGKLKFVIRRGIRKLVLATLFAIEALEGRVRSLCINNNSMDAAKISPPPPTDIVGTKVNEISQKFAEGWEKWDHTDRGGYLYYQRPYCLTRKQVDWIRSAWLKQFKWGKDRNKAEEQRTLDNLGCSRERLILWQIDIHKNGSGTFYVVVPVCHQHKTESLIKQPTSFTVRSGQLVPTFEEFNQPVQKTETFTVHCGQLVKQVTNEEKFVQYLDSLQLPELVGGQSPEQLTHCQHLRELFVRNNLYRLLAYDSRNPLLVFAPVILKLKKFKSALYWLENEDYQVRSDINWAATNKYYAVYPEKEHHRKRCIPGLGSEGDRFFFTRKSLADQWEVWHYLTEAKLAT